jgi:hypothetical protein
MIEPAREAASEPAPKSRGCLFWGCLTVVVLFLSMAGCVGVGLYMMRQRFTSPTPEPVPQYQAKPGEYQEVQERITSFNQNSKEGKPARLELTADDLNALISQDPRWKAIRGNAFVRIAGDSLLLDVSMPLDRVPGFRGRYLNGSLGIRPQLADGRLRLYVESAKANDRPLQGPALEALRQRDLLEDTKDPRVLDFARKAKTLEVRDGKLILTAGAGG